MSSLMDAIKELERELESKKKKPKWQILKEQYSEEIEEMIKAKIPVKKQIELLLQYSNIKKLTYSEYYNILVKYFNYKKRYTRKKIFEISEDKKLNKQPQQQPKKTEPKRPNRTDPVEDLSKDVDIYQLGMKKRVEEMQEKGLL